MGREGKGSGPLRGPGEPVLDNATVAAVDDAEMVAAIPALLPRRLRPRPLKRAGDGSGEEEEEE